MAAGALGCGLGCGLGAGATGAGGGGGGLGLGLSKAAQVPVAAGAGVAVEGAAALLVGPAFPPPRPPDVALVLAEPGAGPEAGAAALLGAALKIGWSHATSSSFWACPPFAGSGAAGEMEGTMSAGSMGSTGWMAPWVTTAAALRPPGFQADPEGAAEPSRAGPIEEDLLLEGAAASPP